MSESRPTVPVHARDVWWTVLFIDRLAVPLVRVAYPRPWVTPFRLTMAANILGASAAVAFVAGWLIPAAVLFEIRFVLDCMDGKLARMRRTPSRSGAYFDFVSDYVVAGLCFAGFAYHLQNDDVIHPALAIALPTIFLMHLTVRLSSEQEGEMKRVAGTMPSRYQAWMASRRLDPVPSRIDFEHGLLFVAPVVYTVVDTDAVAVAAVGLTVVYFTYVMTRFGLSGYRSAKASDEAAD